MQKEPLLVFSGISKSFGDKKVLNEINLEIYENEILGLIGRSGSGKSTLLKILLGDYLPESGKIFFKGTDITKNTKYLKQIIGLTTQENSFYERLTVYENMRYYSSLYNIKKKGKELESHINKILSDVMLEQASKTQAINLSGGMKRRLDFAISIVHEPSLLILDEPTTGLDPLLVMQFWQIVKKIAKTTIVISHMLPEIKANCKRACILNKGKATIYDINHSTDMMKLFSEKTA